MAARARIAFFEALDRLGLLKYLLATLLTALAFTLTAGAFCYEQLGKRPRRLSEVAQAALREASRPSPAAAGHSLRAPVSPVVRYAAASRAAAP